MFVFLEAVLTPHPAPHVVWANQNSHGLRSCQQPLSKLVAASHAIYTHTHTDPPLHQAEL